MAVDAVVAKIGDFLNERAPEAGNSAPTPGAFSGNLARVRDEVNHHVILLALLAHADGEAVEGEQSVILNYCLNRAERAGIALSETEKSEFSAYLRMFRPTRMQLSFAVKRLAEETRDELLSLVATAQAVVDADQQEREGEARFLADIRRELSAL